MLDRAPVQEDLFIPPHSGGDELFQKIKSNWRRIAAVTAMTAAVASCTFPQSTRHTTPQLYTPTTLAPNMPTTSGVSGSAAGLFEGAPANFGEGSDGEWVTDLQNSLNQLGCSALHADGQFGWRTDFVLEQYQQRAGIAVDGLVGQQVIGKITDQLDPNSPSGINHNCGAEAGAAAMPPIPATDPSPEAVNGNLPYGCPGGPEGPPAPNTVCPDGSRPGGTPATTIVRAAVPVGNAPATTIAVNGAIPYGCPGGPEGPPAPNTVCPDGSRP